MGVIRAAGHEVEGGRGGHCRGRLKEEVAESL